MIVTLAGHVDHGKTTLVRLLTGVDTDRLAEEKRRGLTIDLGFAYLQQADAVLGFVDVPGHHRFIHNMVAGVAALQHALLVVAADDGPMPQSREHLQILELLGISHGTIALSKCDRVQPERIAAARAEIGSLVAGTFLASAPIIATAATTGAGIAALRDRLCAAAQADRPAAAERSLRLPVDRAFNLKGSGLVVTGTVLGGTLAIDDDVHVFPTGLEGRVRELRVQDRPADRAGPGDRTAVNLSGLAASAMRRGNWLCAHEEPGSCNLVVELQVLEDFPRQLRQHMPVHVYLATSHTTARLTLLETERLAPGGRGAAELRLDAPLPGKHGDRLVIRDQALERTLGGGRVIDNRPAGGRPRARARLDAVAACRADTPAAVLPELLALGPVALDGFRRLWDLPGQHVDAAVEANAAIHHGDWLIDPASWRRWRDALLNECRQRHRQEPSLQGLRENDFVTPVPEHLRGALLGELVAEHQLDMHTGRYRPPSHRVVLSAAEQELLERLQPLLDVTQPPSLGDLGRALGIPLARLQVALKPLTSKGVLVQVNDKRVYLPAHLESLAGIAQTLSNRAPFSVREYRDAAGVGRNIAIDVLEYFDGRGFTRRSGETRTVTGDRSKLPERLR